MKKQLERLERIKEITKSPEFIEVLEKKIDKIKNGAKINKDGY